MLIAARLWLLFAGFAALQSVTGNTVVTGDLPVNTEIVFTLASGASVSSDSGAVHISAGEAFTAITVKLPSGSIFNVYGARVKIVQGTITSADAAAGACFPGGNAYVGVEVVDSPLYQTAGWQTFDASGVQELTTFTFTNDVRFHRGGVYRLCYSSDGTFRGQAVGSNVNLHADVPDVDIVVFGITSDCVGIECIANRKFPCYSRLGEVGAENACGVTTHGIYGSFGRTSWSPDLSVTYGGDGMPLSIVSPSCGGDPDPLTFCPGGTSSSDDVGKLLGFSYSTLPDDLARPLGYPGRCPAGVHNYSVPVVNATATFLPPSLPLQYGNQTRSVAICYCPGLGGCGTYGEYWQQLGILQLFVAVVVPPPEITCVSSMWGVLAEMLFVVCILCPPGGCPFQVVGSRIRIVENVPEDPEYPPWSPSHSCRNAPTTRHLVPRRPAASWSGSNVTDYEDSDGGHRSDYKRFQPTSDVGFSLPTWPVFKSPGTEVDLCFCLGSCYKRDSWFKVGQIDVFLTYLTSFANVNGDTRIVVPNEIGVPGQLVLDASLLPYGDSRVYGLLPGGAVFVAKFDPIIDTSSTAACLKDVHIDVEGLTRNNMSAYLGTLRGQRLIFDGGVNDTSLTFHQAGAATVCYCPFPDTSAQNGCGSGEWMGVGLLLISGPRANQLWELQTLHTQRIEYYGTDLRGTDRLSFVARDATCSNTTPPADLCPPYFQFAQTLEQDGHQICGARTPLQVVRYADYSTQILECNDQYCTVACNEQNQNCKSGVFLRSITASGGGIHYGFDQSTSSPGGLGDLGLATGDTLMIDSGVECGPGCTQAMLDKVTGYRMNSGLQAVLPVNRDSVYPVVLKRRLFDPSRPWSLMLRVQIRAYSWQTLCVLGDTDNTLKNGEVAFGLAGNTVDFNPLPGGVFLRQRALETGGVDTFVTTGYAGTVNIGDWVHVAIVYSGSVTKEMKVYINGELTITIPKVLIQTTYQPLACGVPLRDQPHPDETGTFFLEDVRWYNTPLSRDEVHMETDKGIMSGVVDALGSSAPLGNVLKTGADAKTFEVEDVAWTPTPEFVVSNAGASWSRTNRAVTRAEILSSQPQNLKVCWEREGRFADIGLVKFFTPERLQDVGVYFTSSAMSVMTPFVLSFRTSGPSSYPGRRYREATGPMRLEIVLLDTDAFDIGQSPYDGYELTGNPIGGEDSLDTATQAMCGVLFREMWSDDPQGGFPLPQGCYYHSLRQGGDGMRKIVILFGARNGLRGGVSYQFVMNGVGYNEYRQDRAIMMVSSMDDIYSQRYSVLESNHAFGNQDFQLVAGKNDPQLAFNDGLVIQGGDQERQLYHLPPETSSEPSISMHIKGADFMTGKIKRKCILRLWLWPLTQWFLPDNCADKANTWSSFRLGAFRVQCTKVLGKFRRCGYVHLCQGSKVVRLGQQTPSIFIELPGEMNDLFGTITYKLDFYGLISPEAGLPPTRIGAQLSTPDDTKPQYYITKGPFITTPISNDFMLGRLLTDPADGLPFEGTQTHLLYMLIGMPVNIKGYYDWALLGGPSIRPTSYFEITVPEGFLCLNITTLPPQGLGKLLYTPYGDAIAKLGDVSQEAPTGFGFPDIRGWNVKHEYDRICRYTLLDQQMIPSRTTMVVGVRVMPTPYALPISNASNLWQISVVTPGSHNVSAGIQSYTTGFYRTGKAGVPVVGQLAEAFVQPSNQALSSLAETTVQTLSVFFTADHNTPMGGSVELEAPEHFNFDNCLAQDLPETYYTTGPATMAYPLPEIVECEAIVKRITQVSRPRFTARIHLVRPLIASRRYGFQITVSNPTAFNMTEFTFGNWILRTRDMYEVVVSSTKDKTPAAIAGALPRYVPFVLRNASLPVFSTLDGAMGAGPGVVVRLPSTLPHFVSNQDTNAVVLFRLPSDFYGTFRLAAPDGYIWCHDCTYLVYAVASLNDFTIIANGSTVAVVVNSLSNSVAGSILNATDITLLGNVLYGLRAPISVPRFSTTTSLHSFFFEFIVDAGTIGDGFSGAVPAEHVKTIFDAQVRSLDHLPGVTSDMLFHLRLSTPVPSPGGVRILFPPGHDVFTFVSPGHYGNHSCQASPWPGEEAWPSDSGLAAASCVFTNDALILRAGIKPLPAGEMRFRVLVTNPLESTNRNWTLTMGIYPSLWQASCSAQPCWVFDSNSNCAGTAICETQSNSNQPVCLDAPSLCTGEIIDAPQGIQGTPLGKVMASAGISGLRPSVRDDQPGRANRLVFYFQLSDTGPAVVVPDGEIILAGPAGFSFQPRCLSLVETRTDVIFGSLYIAETYWGMDPWEEEAVVYGCSGVGQIATIQVASGLLSTRSYAFSIALTNPLVEVPENTWSLSFRDYFAEPFPTFRLWTFTNVLLTPFSPHSGATCFNDGTCRGAGQGVAVPMNIKFEVLNTVSTSGELQITAPEGFGFSPVTPWPTNGEILRTDSPTSCIVRQYADADYSGPFVQWREKDRDCYIVNRGSPIDGTGTGDHRTFRMILRFVFNEVDPTPAKSLHRSNGYEIIVFVDPPTGYRPVTDWQLETFGVTGNSLDIGPAAGFEVVPVFTDMVHSNAGINLMQDAIAAINVEGLSTLVDFVIDLKLPDITRNGDTIVLIAPPTFRMETNGICATTLILEPPRARTPSNQSEIVSCNDEVLRVQISGLGSAIQADTRIRFRIFISNPEAPSPLDENFWRGEHRSSAGGGLKSAAMIKSWHVIPRLAFPTMRLVGTLKGSGSLTTLQLAFRTVQASVEILIEALNPGVFDFTNSFAVAMVGDRRSVPQILGSADNSMHLGTAMAGFTQVSVTISAARLPTISGSSSWRITTYKLAENILDPSILNDEARFEGFYVPGLVTVPSTTAVTGPISAALLGKKKSVVTFQLVISTNVFVGDELHVQVEGAGSEGFELAPRVDNRYGRAPDAILLDGAEQTVGNIRASALGEDLSGLSSCFGAPSRQFYNSTLPIRKIVLRVDRSITAGEQFRMRMTLTTPPDRGILRQENWRFEVWRKGAAVIETDCEAVLVATNDAGMVPLPVVTQLPAIAAKVPHRPPLTVVSVEVVLDPLDTGAQAFVVTAPAGFTFPENCAYIEEVLEAPVVNGTTNQSGGRLLRLLQDAEELGSSNSSPVSPVSPSPDPSSVVVPAVKAQTECSVISEMAGLSRARIMCVGGGTDCMIGVTTLFLTETPRSAPAGTIWFVEAVFVDSDGEVVEQLGRAEVPGFQLSDMPVEISYGALAEVPVEIAVVFTSRVALPPGMFYLHILAANALGRFGCGHESTGFLNPLSLGTVESCVESRNPRTLTVKINGNLTVGIHTITVPAETPASASNPEDNLFEVYLRDAAGRNRDVALRRPGENLAVGVRMIAWPLWWNQIPSYEKSVAVNVPLEFLHDADISVSGILIALPLEPDMKHLGNVRYGSASGHQLPVSKVSLPNQNSVFLEMTPKSYIRSGLYTVKFSVEVPEVAPKVDIWRVALCANPSHESTDEGCTLSGTTRAGRGPSVIAVFTLSGFDPYGAPGGSGLVPMTLAKPASDEAWKVHPLLWLVLVIAFVQWNSIARSR